MSIRARCGPTPFPSGFLEPLAGELGLLTALGTGPTVPNPDFEIPYTDQWMAGVDVQLPYNIGLDVAYVGNKVSKLGVTRNINLVPRSENDKAIPSLGGNTGYLNQTFPNPFAGLIPGQGLNAATVSRGNLLRPYPHFAGGLAMNRLNLGSAYYNALEAAATKRYSNGMMFAVNYTLMKLEDAVNFFTDYDAEPYRDLQGDQRRHRLTITTLVDLPFGPGKPIGGNTHGFVAALIGGLAVQHHWRDPVRPARSVEWQRHPARSGRGAAEERAVVRALVRQQQHGAEQPAAGRLVRLERPRTERLPRRQVSASMTSTSRPSRCGRSRCSRTPPGRGQHAAAPHRDVQRLQRPDLRRAEHQPGERQLRHRRHRQPGQLPAHHSTRSEVCDSKPRQGDRSSRLPGPRPSWGVVRRPEAWEDLQVPSAAASHQALPPRLRWTEPVQYPDVPRLARDGSHERLAVMRQTQPPSPAHSIADQEVGRDPGNRTERTGSPGQLPELTASVRRADHIKTVRVARPRGNRLVLDSERARRAAVCGHQLEPRRLTPAGDPDAIGRPRRRHRTADAQAEADLGFTGADANLDQALVEGFCVIECDPGAKCPINRPRRQSARQAARQ